MRKLGKKKIEKAYYAKFIEDDGSEKIVVGKDKDKVAYLALHTAYNPSFEDTGKIVRVNEDELYANSRHHTKDIIIVDGDVESYAGFILSTKKHKRKKNTNATLDTQKTIMSSEPKPQYMEKKLTIKEKDKDKLLKVDKNSRNRRVFNPGLTSEQVDIIKNVSSSEANRRQSKEYRKKKK